jgi:hypothetical protein
MMASSFASLGTAVSFDRATGQHRVRLSCDAPPIAAKAVPANPRSTTPAVLRLPQLPACEDVRTGTRELLEHEGGNLRTHRIAMEAAADPYPSNVLPRCASFDAEYLHI